VRFFRSGGDRNEVEARENHLTAWRPSMIELALELGVPENENPD